MKVELLSNFTIEKINILLKIKKENIVHALVWLKISLSAIYSFLLHTFFSENWERVVE